MIFPPAHRFQKCVAHPENEYIGIKEKIERRLGGDTPLSVFWLMLEKPDQVRQIALEAGRQRFLEIRDIPITEKLAALSQSEVDRRMREADRRSHALLRFDNNSLRGADPRTGTQLTGHLAEYHSKAMLATCHPADDPEVNLNPKPEQRQSKLAQAFKTQTTGVKHEPALQDRYRLVFAREKAVFPLYCIADLQQLRAAYLTEMSRHNAKPRETDRRVDFPDIFPPSAAETEMPVRVNRALTLGRAFKFVRQDRDVRTEEPAIIYSYRNQHHRLRDFARTSGKDDRGGRSQSGARF